MRSWLAIMITLTACADPEIERLEHIKATVCACKTASCAEQEIKLVPQSTDRAGKSTHHRQEIARGMLDCFAKLLAAERPSDPEADADEAAGPADPAPTPGTPAPAPPDKR